MLTISGLLLIFKEIGELSAQIGEGKNVFIIRFIISLEKYMRE